MLVLQNGYKIRGDAENADEVDYTIHGLDNNVLTPLATGQLPAATGDLYTADSTDVVVNITLVNTGAAAQVVNVFLYDGANSRKLFGITLGAGYSACYDGKELNVNDAEGRTMLSIDYTAHSASHENGGADEISLAGLDGESAELTTHKADGSAHQSNVATITFPIDGGGSVIGAGLKMGLEIPFACTITRATLLGVLPAATNGSIVLDIWKDSYANHPPLVGDSITAAAKPTIAAAQKAQDSTLTGWTTAIAAGDILFVNVDSCAIFTCVTLSLRVTKT